MFSSQNPATQGAPNDSILSFPGLNLMAEGFTPQQIAQLSAARCRFAHGDLNEWTGDYKRLIFARWLYQHGRISG